MNSSVQPGGVCLRTAACALLSILLSSTPGPTATAQVTQDIATVTYSEATSGRSLDISVELQQGQQAERVYLRYRVFTRSEYTTLEMNLVNNVATARIPAEDVLAPFIEYYLIVASRDGTLQTSPPGEALDPFSTAPAGTFQLPIKDTDRSPGILLLSPDPNERLLSPDVLIAVSLPRVDILMESQSARLLVDGVDVTAEAVLSDVLLVYIPDNFGVSLAPGDHSVEVRLFDASDSLYEEARFTFSVTAPGIQERPAPPGILYSVDAQLESRHEAVSDVGTWYNRASARLRGSWNNWALVSNFFVTSDESSNRQPQNRYFVGLESSWLQAGYGDSYPVFPSLIMNGKRIRGFNGRVQAGPQVFMVAAGETDRGIDGRLLKSFPAESLAVEQQRDLTTPYAPIDATTWGKFSYGTFERDVLVLRSETRPGKMWAFGISALKGKDNIESIRFGTRPQENLVVGVDLGGGFDDRRVEFSGQAAFSAFNSDISSGTFSDAYIDTTFESNADEIKNVRDILDNFITVNDNLRPLSFKELSTIAYEFSLGVNYVHNALKATYLYRGSDYTSFGQTFLRKDIQGVTASDRISLAENQVLLSLGFEHLQDNTSNFKSATTTFENYSAALSYYPRTDAPTITVGFGRYASDNGLSTSGSDSLLSIDDEDYRFYVQCSYTADLGAKHTGLLHLSTSDRNDNSPRRFDVTNTTVDMRVTTRYAFPLETGVALTFSLNTLPGATTGNIQENDYTTLSLNGRYLVWDERLTLEARLTPTFGDFDRTVWEAATSYALLPNMILQMRFSYFDNDGIVNDSIWGLTYRFKL